MWIVWKCNFILAGLIHILNAHKSHDFKHELSLSYMQVFFTQESSESCMTLKAVVPIKRNGNNKHSYK